MFDTDLGPNSGGLLGSCIVRDVEKFYGQNLTIICRAKGWFMYGCGNYDRHRQHAIYFGSNRESNCALFSGPRFTHAGLLI